jgi:hypothetical protein
MGAGTRVCVLVALATLAAPAAAQATLVTAQPDGVLAIAAETAVSSGGSGFSGVGLSHTTTFGQAPDPTKLVIRTVSPTMGMPEMLNLAGSASWCDAEPATGPVVSITCDVAAIDHVAVDLGDGDDFLLAQSVTDVGDHTTADPTTDPALIADLGAGDDQFVGGPLAETIEDGAGADNVSGYAPGGGGNDLLIQPDVADPATQDSGDLLDTDYDHGMVDYSRRTNGQGVSVTTHAGDADDGAAGEQDTVRAHGVRGTGYDDTLMGLDVDLFHETFFGGAGHDVIDGFAGAEDIHGGDGPDDLTGGAGADTLSGDAGDDTLHADDKQADGVACGTGSDTVRADRARDVVEAAGAGGAGCEAVTLLPTLTAPVLGTTKPAAGTAGGATSTPRASAAAPAGATATLKGGRARIDRAGRVKLAFACPAAASCARRAFLLKVKVGRKTYTVVVKVKALAAGRRGVMTAKLPKRLAAAVRRAGKQGLKARLGTKGAKARTLRLTSG